jgi:hypothetical protein
MALPGSITPDEVGVPPRPVPQPPPLQNGDRLTRDEFERRYEAMPHLKKAELIEGEVYMPSPVSTDQHGGPQADFMCWLGLFRAYTPGVRVADNSTVRLDLDNEPQPDGLLFVEPAFGGQAKLDPKGYIEGAPEWVGEISASSVSIDLNKKFHVYRRHGVREYVVWRVQDGAIDWFVNRKGQFDRLQQDGAGIYRSEVFPGLWLDAPAMIRGDMATVLEKLQEGIDSPEHAAFLNSLQHVNRKQ